MRCPRPTAIAAALAAAALLAGQARAGHIADEPSPQVGIEARFLSVDFDFMDEIGVDFGLPGGLPWTGEPQPSARPVRVPELGKLPVLGRALASGDDRSDAGTLPLAVPRLVTLSGQAAQIQVGDRLPAGSGVGDEDQPFGIRLGILPHVTPDGRVVLTIDVDVDRVRSGPGGPVVHSRRVETSTVVRDGETVVIGGLYDSRTRTAASRIPVLGDIPTLGALFRNEQFQQGRRDLVILVTPHIVGDVENGGGGGGGASSGSGGRQDAGARRDAAESVTRNQGSRVPKLDLQLQYPDGAQHPQRSTPSYPNPSRD